MALERVSSIHVYTTPVVYTYILPQLWCGEANSSSIWVTAQLHLFDKSVWQYYQMANVKWLTLTYMFAKCAFASLEEYFFQKLFGNLHPPHQLGLGSIMLSFGRLTGRQVENRNGGWQVIFLSHSRAQLFVIAFL